MPAVRGPAEENRKAAGRLGLGAWLGLLAACLAVVIPSVAVFLSAFHVGGPFAFGTNLLEAVGAFVLAGAVLYILSLFLYRRAFATLRQIDPDFALASVLCFLGSAGFALLLIAAAVLTGTASDLKDCLSGHPSHILACLQSNQPLGGYTAIVGFVLGWIGGIGVVLGLRLAGSHYQRRGVTLGAILYLFFLLLVLVPLVEFAVGFPGASVLLLLVPMASVLAPLFVLYGIRIERRGTGAPPTA